MEVSFINLQLFLDFIVFGSEVGVVLLQVPGRPLLGNL